MKTVKEDDGVDDNRLLDTITFTKGENDGNILPMEDLTLDAISQDRNKEDCIENKKDFIQKTLQIRLNNIVLIGLLE